MGLHNQHMHYFQTDFVSHPLFVSLTQCFASAWWENIIVCVHRQKCHCLLRLKLLLLFILSTWSSGSFRPQLKKLNPLDRPMVWRKTNVYSCCCGKPAWAESAAKECDAVAPQRMFAFLSLQGQQMTLHDYRDVALPQCLFHRLVLTILTNLTIYDN